MTPSSTEPTTAAELPPHPPEQILAADFPERVRLVCRNWAAQVNRNQPAVMALYWAKYFFVYIGGWALLNVLTTERSADASLLELFFSWTAFQKAVAWSMFYELTGLGCSWGPMNARFKPMTISFRYYLRPGTTKLPLFPGAPVIGSPRRSILDVAFYLATQLSLLWALVQPEVTASLLLPAFVLVPLLGVLDKTLFLAARAEHYWVALTILVVGIPSDDLWIAGCKMLWCCIWFWAATSKVNHHFPSVIMFMMNNGPFFPKILKKRLFVSYPDDLRPSKFATVMAHFGTATEYSLAFILLLAPSFELSVVGLCMMFAFHGYIALNNPNGMPIEWNILMVYGGIFLFGFNYDTRVTELAAAPVLLAFITFCSLVVPTLGNFFPRYCSFLLSMRYYAGNWAYNVWLFRKDTRSYEKLKEKMVIPIGSMKEQLQTMKLPAEAVETAVAMSLSSRFMHLQGRPLLHALPEAVDDIEDYDWFEGEVLGGQLIGWNFGDGHLNNVNLLRAVQEQVGFEPGELRVVSVESQPLFGPAMAWEVNDAATGLVASGRVAIDAEKRSIQGYPTGEYREAILRGRSVG